MAPPSTVRAYISVGSNIDPAANMVRALSLLRRRVCVQAVSSMVRTRPIGPAGQPPFVNSVWCILTNIPARRLKFDVLRDIEAQLGRVRSEDRYAPRPIDLDLLLYGDVTIDQPDMHVPDPDVARPFVRACLAELAPNLRLPGEPEPVSSTLDLVGPMPYPVEVDLTTTLRESLQS